MTPIAGKYQHNTIQVRNLNFIIKWPLRVQKFPNLKESQFFFTKYYKSNYKFLTPYICI